MTVEQALAYQEDGWAVIPLKIDKRPYLPEGEQKKYLYQAATEAEIRDFWKRYPNANVGLACGKVSGLTVVDIDDGVDIFPETRTVLTPTGGTHKIYQYSPTVDSSVGSFYKGIDTRNDGGYIVAAGSHCEYEKKGRKIKGNYLVINNVPPRPFPEALFAAKQKKDTRFDPAKLMGAREGERNATAASVIGLLVSGKPKEIQVPLWELVKSWNAQNKPPLPEQELLSTFNSITNREWSKPKEDIKVIDGLTIRKESRSYVVDVPLPDAKVSITFSEILRSRQSFEAVVKVQLIHNKEGAMPAFEQRLDMNSASAISSLCTSLNSAYGGKPAFNWVLILNRAGIAMKKNVQDARRATKFGADETYTKSIYLVEHFLEPGSPTLIHGDGSTGKSYLCLYMAVCSALGLPFFGKKTTYFRTLYLDHEATAQKLKNRMHRVTNGLGVPFSSLVDHIQWYKPEGSLADEQEIIARMVEEGGYGAVIIDAGASASGGSPMDEQAVLRMFTALDHIPCAKMIIHHEPKALEGVGDDKSYYGTTFWRNAPRLVWRLKRQEKNGLKSIIKAIHHKANDDGESLPFYYSMDFADSPHPTVVFDLEDNFELRDDVKITNFLLHGPANLSAISEAVNIPKSTVERRLGELLIAKKIDRATDNKGYTYSIAPTF